MTLLLIIVQPIILYYYKIHRTNKVTVKVHYFDIMSLYIYIQYSWCDHLPGTPGPTNFAVGPVAPAVDLYTLLAPPTEKLGYLYREIEKNISSVYENLAIFSRRKLVIFMNYTFKNGVRALRCHHGSDHRGNL